MKNKLLLIICSFVSFVAMAQSYRISPSKTLNESAVFNEDNKFKMYFTNISTGTINLHWKVISNNLIAGWDCFICDNVSCCAGVPQNGSLPYIDPGIDVFLALNVNPKAIPGIGILKLYLYEDENPSTGDTLTWVVNSIATGIKMLDVNSSITVFPNPASEYIVIDMNAYRGPSLSTISLYNPMGQLLIEKRINNASEKMDITAVPKGSYRIVIRDDKKNQVVKTVIK